MSFTDEEALLCADNNVCSHSSYSELNESSDEDEIDELTEVKKAICFQEFEDSVMRKFGQR